MARNLTLLVGIVTSIGFGTILADQQGQPSPYEELCARWQGQSGRIAQLMHEAALSTTPLDYLNEKDRVATFNIKEQNITTYKSNGEVLLDLTVKEFMEAIKRCRRLQQRPNPDTQIKDTPQ